MTATPKYVVRYGSMRNLGICTPNRGEVLARSTKVVIRTDRGLEVGEVLCEADDQNTSQLENPIRGQILRTLTAEDEVELMRMRGLNRQEYESCLQHITALELPMQLVDVEHLFGGERIVFYYLAENRVDFRDLVKRLAGEFQTRIEMRQIGVRDEARLLADYGDCGKPVCCNTHLSAMPPVSMKMAKLQRATLDPSKISGRCGRLKCCLRYEYDTYLDLQKELPPLGAVVLTRTGRMKVLGHEILASQLLVETEDHRRIVIAADEILSTLSLPDRKRGGGGKPAQKQADGDEEPTPSADAGPQTATATEPNEPAE